MKPFVVGVTGGSGSGKSYFLQLLVKNFLASEISLLSQDNYYRLRTEQPKDLEGKENYDEPESIDGKAFISDFLHLLEGREVVREEYTYNNPAVSPKELRTKAAPILILEGIFVMNYEEVKNRIDLNIFIDAKEHIRLSRRIKRDAKERGYDLDDVLYRYERHHSPSYEKYIEPLKHHADLIIPNNRDFDRAVEVVATFLKSKIS